MYYYKQIGFKQIVYVHVSTVRRIIALYDSTGDVAPLEYRHGPRRMLGQAEESSIVEAILAKPGAYLDELQHELFKTTGTSASVNTIFRSIHRLGFTRKKLRHVAMQQSESKRKEFMEEMDFIVQI